MEITNLEKDYNALFTIIVFLIIISLLALTGFFIFKNYKFDKTHPPKRKATPSKIGKWSLTCGIASSCISGLTIAGVSVWFLFNLVTFFSNSCLVDLIVFFPVLASVISGIAAIGWLLGAVSIVKYGNEAKPIIGIVLSISNLSAFLIPLLNVM